MSQKINLPYNAVDIMSHLARTGGGLVAKAWALADLRFPADLATFRTGHWPP